MSGRGVPSVFGWGIFGMYLVIVFNPTNEIEYCGRFWSTLREKFKRTTHITGFPTVTGLYNLIPMVSSVREFILSHIVSEWNVVGLQKHYHGEVFLPHDGVTKEGCGLVGKTA
jgi:hypothetical protein